MKIKTEFLFDDQDEFISFFQVWFDKIPANSLISESEQNSEEEETNILEENEPDLHENKDGEISVSDLKRCIECDSEFTPHTKRSKFCGLKCQKKYHMRKYWKTHTIGKDGKIILKTTVSENHVKELLQKCKETGIEPIKEPDLNGRNL